MASVASVAGVAVALKNVFKRHKKTQAYPNPASSLLQVFIKSLSCLQATQKQPQATHFQDKHCPWVSCTSFLPLSLVCCLEFPCCAAQPAAAEPTHQCLKGRALLAQTAFVLEDADPHAHDLHLRRATPPPLAMPRRRGGHDYARGELVRPPPPLPLQILAPRALLRRHDRLAPHPLPPCRSTRRCVWRAALWVGRAMGRRDSAGVCGCGDGELQDAGAVKRSWSCDVGRRQQGRLYLISLTTYIP
ncbi:hypothetical protein C8J57DRAFT_1673980 [Mycena rebaudengoi]|nr:hypothetical protein C8J57DRAFT_1673980 [Mycena rebaudengoi]